MTIIKNVYKHPEKGDKFDLSFNGKIVVLLGPNGAGKTTMLNCFKNILKTDYDIIFDDPTNMDANRSYDEIFDPNHMGHKWTSEGEKMVYTIGRIFEKMGATQRKNKKFVALFDSLDSGLSFDRLKEVVDVLIKYVIKDAHFIAFSANSYELCYLLRDHAEFFWVPSGEWIELPKSFEEFIKMYEEKGEEYGTKID